MNVQQFCEGIKLNPDAQLIVDRYPMSEETYESYKLHFYENEQTFFERVKQTEGHRQLFLYLFVRFAVDIYKEYQIKGISDLIYFDTFSDIQIWCLECKREFDEYGIQEYGWLKEHMKLRLFRLGRLQFQPSVMDCDLEVEGKQVAKHQIVLNVHIPAGEPLHLVEESFDQARAFFRGVSSVFICHSWLMYPKLNEVLKPNSNIIQFQKHFHIYKLDMESKEAEQRIFQKTRLDFTEYSEDTELQRNAKAYLIAGNKLGAGYGIKV